MSLQALHSLFSPLSISHHLLRSFCFNHTGHLPPTQDHWSCCFLCQDLFLKIAKWLLSHFIEISTLSSPLQYCFPWSSFLKISFTVCFIFFLCSYNHFTWVCVWGGWMCVYIVSVSLKNRKVSIVLLAVSLSPEECLE